MPELPEVETTRRGIEPHIVGQTIKHVEVRNPKLRWPVPDNLSELLAGRVIESVKRRAKYLLLEVEGGHLLIHLGMSGSLRMVNSDEPAKKHDHVDIFFSNGSCLRYHDPRRFGAVLWSSSPVNEHELLNKLGPEPLSDDFSSSLLYRRSRNKSQAVKTFIMDSHVVVGVGNIYANEALFKAGIRPDRPAGKISRARYERLTDCIKTTLAEAIRQGGTTLRDFVGGDGKPGYFKQQLTVYGRTGKPCTRCQSFIIESRLGNRSTFYCKKCQR
ncbi:bifunctional DNA-formamidopyrimidine glycosylase/DNA-(apurinic or apyrimidinic site) lyase [Endozoicomonas euniceicola]|uniref:Formamidopyrimidine-DNA glycosylase n=1 Tax=Endozoicomonas euniceicola TaxID=1234143 RepID=A0ABY6H1N3_9GAMM|nr:bifunctional DNA-formamidopyrimidine glycosylase/DNA-(apurinic or apyrimidinic site) lyase [Endozoicomonas euniceicola]UYM18825.1 bifunctional DNA-formamidopyrimidine glycosylase/DNA-(apurinic or apyrimidinic site) lyase [Endozoicomonas euniceicola]